jgi:hypothetical protein
MKQIKTTYLALLPTWWSFIILFIPTIIKAIDIYFTKYEYNNENLTIQKGFLTKKQINIPFYRISDILAEESIFTYGKIKVIEKEKTLYLDYIDRPTQISTELRKYVDSAKDKSVKVIEMQ